MKYHGTCFQLDSAEDANTWHTEAIAFLDRHEIPPTPVCHLVAYQHVSGRSITLTEAIEDKINCNETIDSYLLKNLFDELCHDQDETTKIENNLADLRELLFQALESVTSTCAHTEIFNQTLQIQTQALNSEPDVEELRNIARALLDATSSAIEKNRHMSTQLESVESKASSLQAEVEKLRDEASTDPLTGLYNRKALTHRMQQLLAETEQDSSKPFSLLMLDIDHFKRFNDQFGHIIGDEVIRRVGMAMRDHIRQSDFPARFGGEEFTVVLPSTGIEAAVDIARKIHKAIGKLVLMRRSTKERLPRVTISVGAATLHHGDDCETILERADQALYLAKEGGRNRIATEAEISYM
jgi:diguanylate cyclase